jgi:hypothetical protein
MTDETVETIEIPTEVPSEAPDDWYITADFLTDEMRRNECQVQRAQTYPSMKEQLDYIYHNGIDAWKTDMIDPVKTRFPKPQE